jgi:hypothetical protein
MTTLRRVADALESLPPTAACEALVHLANALEELQRQAALALPGLGAGRNAP